ncbi:MAG TPA: hypothetical protein VJS92_15560 [Candidatus Polarisedimenticolaceae bacterium]|nr:hypothetical protein [Candidatus Polarisedimenticolaceae bacterium]
MFPAQGGGDDFEAIDLPVITGYRVHANTQPVGSPSPTDRNRAAGWVPASPITPLNAPTSVTVNCASPNVTYLGTTLILDSGFELQYVSDNSSRIHCGPNLAEPTEPQSSRHMV